MPKKKRGSLNNQLNKLLQLGFNEGVSKRGYKGQIKKAKSDKIFSYSSYNTVADTSKNLVKFLKENFPEIKYVKDIKKEHVQAYLDFKSETCNDNTLIKIKQNLDTICILGKKFFSPKMDWSCAVPTSKKSYNQAQTKFGKAMPKDDFEKLLDCLNKDKNKGKRYELSLLLKFAYATAMRVDEIAHQKLEDIKLNPIVNFRIDKKDIDKSYGMYGYGTISVSNPKHGRPRTIDILNFDDYLVIKELIDRAEEKGSKYITDIAYSTLTSMLSKVKKEYEIECELAGWHGIRKLSVSDYYNMIRQDHDKRTSIGMANLRLGHGFDRGISALKTYVQNIW